MLNVDESGRAEVTVADRPADVTLILVHTSSMVAIYCVGMVAAVRLLRRGTPAGGWPSIAVVLLRRGMLVLAVGVAACRGLPRRSPPWS